MTQVFNRLDGYPWSDAYHTCAHEFLLPELELAGFEGLDFRFAGRIRPLARSMIAIARRPAEKLTSTRPKTGTSRA